MKSVTIAAVTALLSTGAQAVPTRGQHHAGLHAKLHNRRDVVWKTEWEIATVTIFKTVYGDEPEPTGPSGYQAPVDTPAPITSTSYEAPTAATLSPSETGNSSPAPAPIPSSTSEAPPPATTESTSTYVAPAYTPEPAPSSTEEAPAPAPTSTYVPAPAPATTEAAPAPVQSTSEAAPVAGSTSGSYSGGGSTSAGASYTGDMTYWEPALGACGETNNANEAVVAISQTLFDPETPNGNPNNNPLCGRYVSITGKDGSAYKAKVVDRCVGCQQGDLDLTLTLFNTVTSNGDGRVGDMAWSWT